MRKSVCLNQITIRFQYEIPLLHCHVLQFDHIYAPEMNVLHLKKTCGKMPIGWTVESKRPRDGINPLRVFSEQEQTMLTQIP